MHVLKKCNNFFNWVKKPRFKITGRGGALTNCNIYIDINIELIVLILCLLSKIYIGVVGHHFATPDLNQHYCLFFFRFWYLKDCVLKCVKFSDYLEIIHYYLISEFKPKGFWGCWELFSNFWGSLEIRKSWLYA